MNLKNKGDKILFSVQSKFSFEFFKESTNNFNRLAVWWEFIVSSTIYFIILLIIGITFKLKASLVFISYFSLFCFFALIKIFRRNKKIQALYKQQDKIIKNKYIIQEFYNDYFIQKMEFSIIRINYADIISVTEENSYFLILTREGIIGIQKEKLKDNESEFIRNIKKDSYYNKTLKKLKHKKL